MLGKKMQVKKKNFIFEYLIFFTKTIISRFKQESIFGFALVHSCCLKLKWVSTFLPFDPANIINVMWFVSLQNTNITEH